MAFLNRLNKLSMAAAISAAALLVLETVSTAPAQAALFKFSFEGTDLNNVEAKGYFIYDDSTLSDSTPDSPLSNYYGSVRDYSFDIGNSHYEGTDGSTTAILRRTEYYGLEDPSADAPNPVGFTTANEFDQFEFKTALSAKDTEYFSAFFTYNKGALGESTAQPTKTLVPSTAAVSIFPELNTVTKSVGLSIFLSGLDAVQTQITPVNVPEPGYLSAIFGVGIWLLLSSRRHATKRLTCLLPHHAR